MIEYLLVYTPIQSGWYSQVLLHKLRIHYHYHDYNQTRILGHNRRGDCNRHNKSLQKNHQLCHRILISEGQILRDQRLHPGLLTHNRILSHLQ